MDKWDSQDGSTEGSQKLRLEDAGWGAGVAGSGLRACEELGEAGVMS